MAAPEPAPYSAQLTGSDRTPPPRTLIAILLESAENFPDADALDDGNGALTYAELIDAVKTVGRELHLAGLGPGDRIGVRIPSGTRDLYIGILAVLMIGAAYVPVDVDDPDERATLVFSEADVAAVITGDGIQTRIPALERNRPEPRQPLTTDDAWIIFTSGSTGTPKGVAVTHRNAAAFVDAEARLFLQAEPLGPGNRVLAGLSVAFDASCEEMWLAWGHGACLVPAPRALVRTGMDLGPWIIDRDITVISTVPTLAALWPAESLENIRLLIFGGEACPPELAGRLATEGREVWNTYGPTEATVVACGAQMDGSEPIRIGLPLDGWDLAVLDKEEVPVAAGEIGELVIGGVGLARYLDPAKDAQKYAPLANLGWERAYRSGDLVRYDPEGLVFVGRADDQVKLGGRRIELGEIDAALQAVPGVRGGAAAVKTTAGGDQVLVGYLAVAPDAADLDLIAVRERLAAELPAALIPQLAVVDDLPTRTSGKVDRNALPWPLPRTAQQHAAPPVDIGPQGQWILEQFSSVLGASNVQLDDDFFSLGGTSLTAARLVSAIRQRYPNITVADIYARPRTGALIDSLVDASQDFTEGSDRPAFRRKVLPTARRSQIFQTLMGIPLNVLVAMRWLTYALAISNILAGIGVLNTGPVVSWWLIAALWLVFLSPVGRMGIAVLAARVLLRDVRPGVYPRSGKVHLRLWLAEQVQDLSGAITLASAPLIPWYARALGARVGRQVDLHSVPPVTGMLKIGDGAAVEPDVDLSGWWIDGDEVHIGKVRIGAGATVGARSTLMPGSRVGAGAKVEPGSAVTGKVSPGLTVSGAPATRTGRTPSTREAPPASNPLTTGAWWLAATLLSLAPLLPAIAALAVLALGARGHDNLADAALPILALTPVAALVWFVSLAVVVLVIVRLLGLGLKPGWYPVRSFTGWRVWATVRLLDQARDLLFPIYASLFTPIWLRLLGAKVGNNVEASTVLLVPSMVTIRDDAFLADDTMVSTYQLNNGWLHIGPTKVGRRAFVGNSGIAAPGRTVPKDSLVAVLSAAPKKAKSGSSWLGSPPSRLRRQVVTSDDGRTYDPPAKLRWARAGWELCRAVPVVCTMLIAVGVVLTLDALTVSLGWWAAALLGGAVIMIAGAIAAGLSVAAKWLIVGPIRAGDQPLWSSFVWRNEVVDTFIELVSAPWFARVAAGTPALVLWLRALGAKIGRGAWCESYWLPEADLVTLGENATVNRGCVVQTHLFHDRVMSMDAVTIDDGATLGPHGVILPAAEIGRTATVGPASLVMRGESIPEGTYWMGNPVSPWQHDLVHLDRTMAAAALADDLDDAGDADFDPAFDGVDNTGVSGSSGADGDARVGVGR